MVIMVTRGARCVPSQVRADGEEAVQYTTENAANLSKEWGLSSVEIGYLLQR